MERTRAGTYVVSGQIVTEPGPADLDAYLSAVTGGVKTANVFALTDKLITNYSTGFYIAIDRIAQMHIFNNCQCDRGRFHAMQGGILELSLDMEGLTESIASGGQQTTFQALAPTTAAPYVLMDAALTYGGTTYQFREVEVVVDNSLKKDRFMNSISRTDLPALDRTIMVNLSLPYTSDTITLYDNNATQGHVIVTFTNGTNVLTIDMIAVQFPTIPPDTPGREEILLPLGGIARKSGTTLEAIFTNVG